MLQQGVLTIRQHQVPFLSRPSRQRKKSTKGTKKAERIIKEKSHCLVSRAAGLSKLLKFIHFLFDLALADSQAQSRRGCASSRLCSLVPPEPSRCLRFRALVCFFILLQTGHSPQSRDAVVLDQRPWPCDKNDMKEDEDQEAYWCYRFQSQDDQRLWMRRGNSFSRRGHKTKERRCKHPYTTKIKEMLANTARNNTGKAFRLPPYLFPLALRPMAFDRSKVLQC
ncbi:hypothetical protein CI102_2619 [Trichoderma harzianum]|nr:hypothetical protein CI102_2619 [Trichoderma harzianum]